jgi:hypothetical protein
MKPPTVLLPEENGEAQMRRLLIICTTFFPDPGAPAIRMTHLCRHLPTHGSKPFVLFDSGR